MSDRKRRGNAREQAPANQAPDETPDRMRQQDQGQDRPHLWPGQDEPEIATVKTKASDDDRDRPLTDVEARNHPEGRNGGRYPGYLDSRHEGEGD